MNKRNQLIIGIAVGFVLAGIAFAIVEGLVPLPFRRAYDWAHEHPWIKWLVLIPVLAFGDWIRRDALKGSKSAEVKSQDAER